MKPERAQSRCFCLAPSMILFDQRLGGKAGLLRFFKGSVVRNPAFSHLQDPHRHVDESEFGLAAQFLTSDQFSPSTFSAEAEVLGRSLPSGVPALRARVRPCPKRSVVIRPSKRDVVELDSFRQRLVHDPCCARPERANASRSCSRARSSSASRGVLPSSADRGRSNQAITPSDVHPRLSSATSLATISIRREGSTASPAAIVRWIERSEVPSSWASSLLLMRGSDSSS